MKTQNSTKPNKLTTEKLIFREADDLTHQEFRVLAVMLTYTDEHCRNAYPGHVRLMDAVGCKDRKRMTALLKALESKGYLHKTAEGRWNGDRNVAARYDVKVPARILKRVLEAEDTPLVDNSAVADAQSTGGVGVVSTPTVGVVSTPTVGVVSTPLSGPVSDPGSDPKNPYTVIADAPTAHKDSKDGEVFKLSPSRMLHHEARHLILDAMMGVTDPHCIHVDNVLDLLTEHYSETVSDYAANYWTFRNVQDEYEAAKQLNLLVHTVARDLGDEYLIPDNPQVAA